MDFNSILNEIGYEWLKKMNNPLAAIKIFEFGIGYKFQNSLKSFPP